MCIDDSAVHAGYAGKEPDAKCIAVSIDSVEKAGEQGHSELRSTKGELALQPLYKVQFHCTCADRDLSLGMKSPMNKGGHSGNRK